jgi:hypothetical protein
MAVLGARACLAVAVPRTGGCDFRMLVRRDRLCGLVPATVDELVDEQPHFLGSSGWKPGCHRTPGHRRALAVRWPQATRFRAGGLSHARRAL